MSSFTVIEGSVILYDSSGNQIAVSNGQITNTNRAVPVAGTDGTNFRFIKTTTDGSVKVDPTGTTAQPVSQATASNLNATVVQPTASQLNATVAQATAANLNATVVQSTASQLNATVAQPTASSLNATVVQSTASQLNATVAQPTASNLNATVVQSTASNLKTTATQGTAAALAGAWPVQVTDGTNTQPTGDVAARAVFHQITDGTNGPVAVKTAGADGASNTENVLSTLARLAGLNGSGTWDRLRTGLTTVSSTLTGMLNTLPWGVYNSSPTVRTNGQGGPLQTDANGNLLVSMSGATPTNFSLLDPRNTGFSQRVNQVGEAVVQQPIVLVNGPFLGAALDSQFWVTTGSSGSGTTTVGNSIATLATGTTANSVAVLQTTLIARAAPTHPNSLRTNIYTPDSGTANNVRRIGVDNGTDGFGFVINGAGSGNLGIYTRKAGGAISDTYVLNGNAGASVNWTAGKHTLEIEYLTSNQYFFLDKVLIHTITPTTTTTTAGLNFPIRFTNTNSNGSTTNVTMDVWTAAIRKLGNSTARPTYKHIAGAATTVLKISPGTLYTIVAGKTTGTVSIYDNPSGTTANPIAIMDLSGSSPAAVWNFGSLGVDFLNGLTVVTSASGVDLTVIYE